MQCNQIFIGMVTMQYQVITDMVRSLLLLCALWCFSLVLIVSVGVFN